MSKYGIAKSRAAIAKKSTDLEKVYRNKKRDYYRGQLSWQHEQTQKAFNKMRVLQELKWFSDRGQEPECISCGKTKMDWCAGHYKTVGSSPALRYDPNCVFTQCNRYCNQALSGNISGNAKTRGYTQGLIDRFGEEEGRRIIDYCTEHMADKARFTCDELEEMRKGFNATIRELSK
jgi:hypothetical protein